MDTAAILANVRTLRRLLPAHTRIMAVVKADAYGHGAVGVVTSIRRGEPDCAFGVATPDEALKIRQSAPDAEIYVLSPLWPGLAGELVKASVVPVVSEPAVVHELGRAAEALRRLTEVHIEVDTGMGRSGARPEALAGLVEAVLSEQALRLGGIMTHFADAEGDPSGTRQQLQQFLGAVEELPAVRSGSVRLHAANTAAMLLYPETHLDMVRPGLGVYGILPRMPGATGLPRLRQALSLRARILLVREVPAGVRVSYGGTHTLRRKSRLAVLGIGYADGYPWHLSNRCEALIHGRRVPIVGRICMDVCMADVTDVAGATAGDVATLIGQDGEEMITVEQLAQAVGTTEHEITTRLGPRLPRIYMC